MTNNEIVLLTVGIGIGAQAMAVAHMVGDMRTVRRAQTEAEAAVKAAAGDRYLSSLRLYQLQNRSRA
ncbi:hypothetical protein H9W91_17515 [Streptomyces alfalfae]|uniref:hypothetical protein n=1 Tax=Streptomyces alfalfae TaxID=1642299 RepID=UPI001BAA7EDA|nr:hypothetical protein [Streptomyces alfalfae]QUI32460.1 hypothetical protein H9W91_17515 [Streptomyces alfalfae]